MKRLLLIALSLGITSLAPPAAEAQSAAIMPARPLDARRAKVRDELVVVRDSLNGISAAAARLHRDSRVVSAITLTARARVLAGACDRAARLLPPARATVTELPSETRGQVTQRADLLREFDLVQAAVTRCSTEFTAMSAPGNGEEVRGYANRRAEPLLQALSRYEGSLTGFFAAYDIEVRPIGAGKNPLAG